MTNNTDKKASHGDWHPADIKAALHKKGITLSSLAQSCGMNSSSSLSAAFVRSYPANEKRIAEAIGVHPKVIWPSRYLADGSRKPQGFNALKCTGANQQPSSKYTKLSTKPNCQHNGKNQGVA